MARFSLAIAARAAELLPSANQQPSVNRTLRPPRTVLGCHIAPVTTIYHPTITILVTAAHTPRLLLWQPAARHAFTSRCVCPRSDAIQPAVRQRRNRARGPAADAPADRAADLDVAVEELRQCTHAYFERYGNNVTMLDGGRLRDPSSKAACLRPCVSTRSC